MLPKASKEWWSRGSKQKGSYASLVSKTMALMSQMKCGKVKFCKKKLTQDF